MEFHEGFQNLKPLESLKLFYADDAYHDAIEYIYTKTTPALFSHNGLKHCALEAQLRRNHHMFELNKDGDIIYLVGYFPDEINNTFVISSLYVHPDYRRKGIAKKIISFFQEDVCPEHLVILTAVSPSNKEAIKLFHDACFSSPIAMDAPDDLGASYVDMFWSKQKFKVFRLDRRIKIEFHL